MGPASMLVGNLVAGKRIAQATGRELGVVEDQDLIRKVLRSDQRTVLFTKYQRCNVTFEICLHIKHLTSKPTV